MDLNAMSNEQLFNALVTASKLDEQRILVELDNRVGEGDWSALYF